MIGRIISDTAISGEPVAVGEIVEVDEGTFRQLLRCGRIEAYANPEEEPARQEKPKFTRKSKNAAAESES